ncbi:putative reverse transcriptase domain-containing protein [Tanacetum coccineum]
MPQNGEQETIRRPRPLWFQCNYHHDGPCAPKCHKCNRFGHLSRDCNEYPQMSTPGWCNQGARSFRMWLLQRHFNKDLPKIEEQQHLVNQLKMLRLRQRLCRGRTTGANLENMTVTTSPNVITPTALDHDYNVELADGRIVGLNTIIPGYWASPKQQQILRQFLGLAAIDRRSLKGCKERQNFACTTPMALPRIEDFIAYCMLQRKGLGNVFDAKRKGKANVVCRALSMKEREQTKGSGAP